MLRGFSCFLFLLFFSYSYSEEYIDKSFFQRHRDLQAQYAALENANFEKENSLLLNGTKNEIRRHAGGTVVSPNCFIPNGREYCAPQYIIAGSMKCGTTSLHSYLLNHPQVVGIKDNAALNGKPILANKEIRFFSNITYSKYLPKISLNELEGRYFNIFEEIKPLEGSNQIFTGDATPMYVSSDRSAKRAYHALPEAKVIIMVRNPIDRLYSEFWFQLDLEIGPKTYNETSFPPCIRADIAKAKYCGIDSFLENPTVDSALQFKSCLTSISRKTSPKECELSNEYEDMCIPKSVVGHCTQGAIRNSLYVSQILEWIEMYGDNLMIVNSDEFYSNTASVMKQIADFIGLSEDFNWSSVTDKAYNIVNPLSYSGKQHELVSTNSGGLFVGASSSSSVSNYPPLDQDIRDEFHEFFIPANEALAKVLNRPNFWP